MISFVIKSGICMVLLFGLYWLLLRKEKLFIFNRFYLIFSVLFSLAVPFISLPVSLGYKDVPAMETVSQDLPFDAALSKNVESPVSQKSVFAGIPPDHPTPIVSPEPFSLDGKNILIYVYLAGLLILLIRFCRNMMQVSRMLRKSEKIEHEWYRVALINEKITPFSFLRTVFLNRQDYFERRVGDNVMNHELEHIRQAHSLDVILFEIIHMAFWFNPVLYFYKRAARINHEYLADEAVVNGNPDLNNYMNELITFISHRLTVPYTSGFSPSMIKLRLLMLNTKTSRQGKVNRISLTLMMSVILTAGLSMKPVYKEPDERRKRALENKDIIIKDVFFRDKDFNPMKTLVVLNGKVLQPEDSLSVNISDIRNLNLLSDRKAKRKYGRNAKNGVFEISTYENDKSSVPDSLYFKPIYTINNKIPEKRISILVSNIYSVSMWTYPVFRNQDPDKRWRLLEMMTRDYYKIGGSVLQSNGQPISGALVTAVNKPSEVETGEDGRFNLSDVNPGTKIEFSATGYTPYSFKVEKGIFNTELAIALRKINEPDSDLMITGAGKRIIDFSGRWKINREMSKINFPDDYLDEYDIQQYNSDSIRIINTSRFRGEYHSGARTSVFNRVKIEMGRSNISKYISSCIISPDGNSFSFINRSKTIIANQNYYGFAAKYSLSEDGKHLFITESSFQGPSSNNERQFPPRVYDRE